MIKNLFISTILVFLLSVSVSFASAVVENSTYNNIIWTSENISLSMTFFSERFANGTGYYTIGCDNRTLRRLYVNRYNNFGELSYSIPNTISCAYVADSQNLFYGANGLVLITFVMSNSSLALGKFNYSDNSFSILGIIENNINTSVDGLNAISISNFLQKNANPSGIVKTDGDTIAISYMKGSEFFITFNQFDKKYNSFNNTYKTTYKIYGVPKKIVLTATNGNCIYTSNCVFGVLFEGTSAQNSNRYGIYYREIYTAYFDYTDKGLIGFNNPTGFQTSLVQNVSWWNYFLGYPSQEGKIYVYQNTTGILAFLKFEPRSWNYENFANRLNGNNNTALCVNATPFSLTQTGLYSYYDVKEIVTSANNVYITGEVLGGKYNNYLAHRNIFIKIFNNETSYNQSYSDLISYQSNNVYLYDYIHIEIPDEFKNKKVNISVNISFSGINAISKIAYRYDIITPDAKILITEDTIVGESEAFAILYPNRTTGNCDVSEICEIRKNNFGIFGIQTTKEACVCSEWSYSQYNSTAWKKTRNCEPSGCSYTSLIYTNTTEYTTTTTTPTYGVNDTYIKPIFSIPNKSGNTGIEILNMFLTPFALVTFLMLGVATYLTIRTKTALVFIGTIILFSLIYTILGIYPFWIILIFIILMAFIVAKYLSGGLKI